MDLDALWQGLSGGTFAIFLSDYASDSNYHPRGKKAALSAAEAPLVCKILNRLPGVETRMTMLMSEGAELTSMNHAKLYGMRGQKGTIASGMIQTWSSGTQRLSMHNCKTEAQAKRLQFLLVADTVMIAIESLTKRLEFLQYCHSRLQTRRSITILTTPALKGLQCGIGRASQS